jgi:hypothetical protein
MIFKVSEVAGIRSAGVVSLATAVNPSPATALMPHVPMN